LECNFYKKKRKKPLDFLTIKGTIKWRKRIAKFEEFYNIFCRHKKEKIERFA